MSKSIINNFKTKMTEVDAPEVLQQKLYFLVEQLQNMAREIPE